jgi:hypothetical protein
MAKGKTEADGIEIKGNNDRERIIFIANNFNSLSEIPRSQIATVSDDGEVIITVHGTKVSDAIIRQVMTEEKAKAAAQSAAANAGVDLEDEKFIEKVTAIATQAAMNAINAANAVKK